MKDRLDLIPVTFYARVSSELTERRSFVELFVKEIIVIPGQTEVHDTMPMPPDSRIAGMDIEEVAIPRPAPSAEQPAAV